jgi:hypothetical protein
MGIRRGDLEIDESLRLRRGNATLRPLDDGVEAAVDRVADALRKGDRAVFGMDDETDRTGCQRHAAAGYASP